MIWRSHVHEVVLCLPYSWSNWNLDPGQIGWEVSALTTAPSLAPRAIPCTPNYWFMIPEKPHRRRG